jgi:hypothetical protein
MDNPDPLDSLWLTISELGRRRGVTAQAIWKRVRRLARDNKIEVRAGRGRERLVNLAQYDRVTGETANLARQQGAATARGVAFDDEPLAAPGSPSVGAGGVRTFTEAQRQAAIYGAGLKALEFNERRGALLPIDGEHGVARAARAAGDALVAAVAQFPLRAGELVAVAGADGEVAVRRVLKEIGTDLLKTFAKSLHEIAATANAAGNQFKIDLPEPEAEDMR